MAESVEGTSFAPRRVGDDAAALDYVQHLETLHDAITAGYESLPELCEAYLDAGCRIFRMQTGIISRIEGERYTVVAVRTPIEGLAAGAEFPLCDTYCREVVRAQRTLGFPQVGASKALAGHPVYESLGLEAYLSAPIYANGALYGTVNFTSTEARPDGFTQAERHMIDLIARAAGQFVEQLEARAMIARKSGELEEANRRLREFVGIVAHDLRNPIGAMEGYGRALLRMGELDGKSALFAERLVRVASQSRQLVSDLLDISALQLGSVHVEPAPFAVDAVVDDVLLTVEGAALDKGVRLVSEVAVAEAHGDAARIQQVLANLVHNAVKFTEGGGLVVVGAGPAEEGAVRLWVRDTGIGLDAVQLARLREGSPDRRRGTAGEGGTGFGLRLVREVLEAHGSDLQVDSDGAGTTFSFVLGPGALAR